MTNREKAKLMLETLDEMGPVNINWNQEGRWLEALSIGFGRVEKAERMEDEA